MSQVNKKSNKFFNFMENTVLIRLPASKNDTITISKAQCLRLIILMF